MKPRESAQPWVLLLCKLAPRREHPHVGLVPHDPFRFEFGEGPCLSVGHSVGIIV